MKLNTFQKRQGYIPERGIIDSYVIEKRTAERSGRYENSIKIAA